MTMAVLRDLATKVLPTWVSGDASVDAIRILELAGHIKASEAPIDCALHGQQPTARVLAITGQGYRMLKYFPAN